MSEKQSILFPAPATLSVNGSKVVNLENWQCDFKSWVIFHEKAINSIVYIQGVSKKVTKILLNCRHIF